MLQWGYGTLQIAAMQCHRANRHQHQLPRTTGCDHRQQHSNKNSILLLLPLYDPCRAAAPPLLPLAVVHNINISQTTDPT
jgi:hypothetical protein